MPALQAGMLAPAVVDFLRLCGGNPGTDKIAQQAHGFSLVGELRPLARADNGNRLIKTLKPRAVCGAHAGLHFVHVLAAVSAAAEGVEADEAFVPNLIQSSPRVSACI